MVMNLSIATTFIRIVKISDYRDLDLLEKYNNETK